MRSDRESWQQLPEENGKPGEKAPREAHQSQLQHEIADLELFRVILDHSVDAIFLVDADSGRILDVSGSACRRLGYERRIMLSMSIVDVIGESAQGINSSISTGHAQQDVTMILHGRDGVTIPCSISANVTRIDGKAVALFIARDITERKRAEDHIRASLQEKEVMLKEIHHRVKNNLQVISSLLSIQERYLSDPRDSRLFQESQDRIKTMALVHEKLYQSSDLASVDFSSYIERLATNLFRSYGGKGGNIRLRTDVRDIYLNVDTAVPCGLIVNELVTNALKYAFPGGRDGTITIAMREEDDCYVLEISDDGAGMPAGFELGQTDSLGLQLVSMLAGQIEGTVTMDVSRGTTFVVRFRKPADGKKN